MSKLAKEIPIEKIVARQVSLGQQSHRRETVYKKALDFPSISISRETGSGEEEVVELEATQLEAAVTVAAAASVDAGAAMHAAQVARAGDFPDGDERRLLEVDVEKVRLAAAFCGV